MKLRGVCLVCLCVWEIKKAKEREEWTTHTHTHIHPQTRGTQAYFFLHKKNSALGGIKKESAYVSLCEISSFNFSFGCEARSCKWSGGLESEGSWVLGLEWVSEWVNPIYKTPLSDSDSESACFYRRGACFFFLKGHTNLCKCKDTHACWPANLLSSSLLSSWRGRLPSIRGCDAISIMIPASTLFLLAPSYMYWHPCLLVLLPPCFLLLHSHNHIHTHTHSLHTRTHTHRAKPHQKNHEDNLEHPLGAGYMYVCTRRECLPFAHASFFFP